jgi:PPM family protein phosphatase
MKLVVGAATDVGRVRAGNEDGYLVDDTVGLVALADGMGGHLGGEVASATALEALRAAVRAGRPLREAMADANTAVFAKAQTDDALTGMGTTLTAGTMAAGGTLILGHVGDSRAYLLRDGVLRRVTTDHSHVQELVDDGQLTDDEAAVHPMRNIVTRSVGIEPTVDVDVITLELNVDDRVVLCSDGLTDMVHEDEIAAELRRELDPAVCAHKLVDRANAAGGVDNITVVVVSVTDAPGSTDGHAPPVELAATVPPLATGELAPREALLVDEPDPRASTPDRAPDPGRRSRRVKTALWVLAVVAVLGVAIGAVAWYARNTYYVTFAEGPGARRGNDTVVVHRGVPGGLLVWEPTVERRTDLTRDDLRPADVDAVAADKTFSSRADADVFVARLRASSTTGSTTPTTTTTTSPTPATAVPPTTIVGP